MLDVQRLRPGDLVRQADTGDVFVVLLNGADGAVVVRADTIEIKNSHGWEQVRQQRAASVQIRAYGEVRNPPATEGPPVEGFGRPTEFGMTMTDPARQTT